MPHSKTKDLHSEAKMLVDHSENLLVHFRRIEDLKNLALGYLSQELKSLQLCDLELLLNREDYERVLDTMRLSDGTVRPIPICLNVDGTTAKDLSSCQPIGLKDEG
jgi:sulfate adenylyltransferase